MKARVDPELCAACAVCIEISPEVFELDERDTAVVTVAPIPPEWEEAVKEAADQCPSGAIVVDQT